MNESKPAAPALAYVALVVDEPARTASVFSDVLGLPLFHFSTANHSSVPITPLGASALAFFGRGEQAVDATAHTGVHHISLSAADPAGAANAWGFSQWTTRDGLAGADEIVLAPEQTADVQVHIARPLAIAPATSAHVERIDHIGVASADNLLAHKVFAKQLGCAVESTQTDFEIAQPIESFTSDKYGVVHHSRTPEPIGGLRVSFLTVGDCELEFLQPFSPNADSASGEAPVADGPGNTRGDKGAIGRYIERRGTGLHHLALKTPDIDATLSKLAASGHRMIDLQGRPGSRRARIGFAHPAALGGLLVHFVEREEL
jgi:catechol 2,3-dioxygenase-like lactoylglutathione lyase family enzyme